MRSLFCREVIVLEYLPLEPNEGYVRFYLPNRDLEIGIGYIGGDTKVMEKNHPVNTQQWVELCVNCNSGGELTNRREKKLDFCEAIGVCKAKSTSDDDGSPLVIMESVIDIVVDKEVLGELASAINVGDWFRIWSANFLLEFSFIAKEEAIMHLMDEYAARKNPK